MSKRIHVALAWAAALNLLAACPTSSVDPPANDDDSTDAVLPPLGSSADVPGADCATILSLVPASTDGNYWIDPAATGAPFEVFCDMSNEGGGWTLVANIDDRDDPYFGGHTTGFFGADWVAAWESDSVRNAGQLASYDTDLDVTAKYRSWSELPATDLRIAYKNDGATFVGTGLDRVEPLSALFASTPKPGECSAEFTGVDQDRFLDPIEGPRGLNCSDPNEGWYPEEPPAENARIGGLDADANCCVFIAWLGAMGDRAFSIELLEKSWGTNWEGVVADDNILVFVR